MISAEAPVLFAKAAQIFITELTLRAWIHTEDNKRRTLQVMEDLFLSYLKSAMALLLSEYFSSMGWSRGVEWRVDWNYLTWACKTKLQLLCYRVVSGGGGGSLQWRSSI